MSERIRMFALFLAAAIGVVSCSTTSEAPGTVATTTTAPGVTTGAGTGATTTSTTVAAPAEDGCPEPARAVPAGDDGSAIIDRIEGPDRVAEAIAVSSAAFRCASSVVVASGDDLTVTALAARLAAAIGGPLLFSAAGPSPELDAEVARLAPNRVILVGDGITVEPPRETDVEALDGSPQRIADLIRRLVPARTTIRLPSGGGAAAVITTLRAIDGRLALEPAAPEPTTTTTAAAGDVTSSSGAGTATTTSTTTPPATPVTVVTDPRDPDLPIMVGGSGISGSVWLVDAGRPEMALVAMVAATVADGLVAFVNGDDLRSAVDASRAIRRSSGGARTVHLIGDVTEDADWQVPVLLGADEIPGGGYLMFPGRRLIALYGNPLTTDLGVLGERDAEDGLSYLRPIAGQYASDGFTIVPAFEIIATVAAGDPGPDGDYSYETSADVIRPWIEAATDNGAYVLLDLQSGRSDSLTQAKIYEEFLRLPNVGLALDPEWRLQPDQVHLQQIGTMRASEVNAVIEWLAGIVREEGLPQKMLLLHQFRFSMLPDREFIQPTPELALVIQMDGQGRIEDKYSTWDSLTDGWQDQPWLWGWKNFYDEDFPTPTPDQVLELTPAVVYVSYQ